MFPSDVKKLFMRDGPNARDEYGNPVLYLATVNDDFRMVREILRAGGDPNIATESGRRAVHVAAFRMTYSGSNKGNIARIVLILKKYGADLAALDEHGDTALENAREHSESLRRLFLLS